MLNTEKMRADVEEMAKQIAKELMAQQTKFFQDEMKKMQDEMSKMKEELSKKVEDAISGKNDTSDKNEANKDSASDIGAGQHYILHRSTHERFNTTYSVHQHWQATSL